ncbi:MAG: cell division protein FtsX [Thermodesulfobacteriota bacterium]
MRLFFRLVGEGLRDIKRTRGIQALTLTAVVMMALLASFFLLVLFNMQLVLSGTQGDVKFQIYWEEGIDPEVVEKQWAELDKMAGSELKTFTPDTALKVMAENFGNGESLDALREDNPLPYTAVLDVTIPGEASKKWSGEFLARLENMQGVAEVHYSPLQMDLAQAWIRIGRTIIWPLNIFLFAMLGLIVANTIKLAQISRREDMEIMAMVGASRFFTRLPLLTVGILQTLLGGLLALGLLKLIQFGLEEILYFPPFWIRVEFLPWPHVLVFLGTLFFVALISGLLAGWEK